MTTQLTMIPDRDSLSHATVRILDAYGYTFKVYQPWQIGLFHEDIDGKFVWYPKKGTLMREDLNGTYNLGIYHDIEDLIAKLDTYLP